MMIKHIARLGIGLIAFCFFNSADCFAQRTNEPFGGNQTDSSNIRHASIHCKATLNEADKDFIVTTFSGFEGKVINCHATPASQIISITYNENLREIDILEVLYMNSYPAYLMKDDHIKIILNANGEAIEESVKE